MPMRPVEKTPMRLLNATGGDYATLLTHENIQHATNKVV
jgi:hypothetical protein